MVEDWVIDCWWGSLPVTLWTWEKVVWRVIFDFLLESEYCKNSSFPPNSLASVLPLPQRKKKRMWSPHKLERRRGTHILFMLSLQEKRNQISLSWAVQSIILKSEFHLSHLLYLLFCSHVSAEKCSSGTEGSRECQSHFRTERTWSFEGKSQSFILEAVLTLY